MQDQLETPADQYISPGVPLFFNWSALLVQPVGHQNINIGAPGSSLLPRLFKYYLLVYFFFIFSSRINDIYRYFVENVESHTFSFFEIWGFGGIAK